ncbi:AsnC family transcriptional regulator [Lachnoclostridium sp. An169]|mgnify:CR=1 FL=1|uniref:Lrp/AsnC family transcriptional regulator n=1 Tax=Lachnoclostridium sp. An169 TaxID=1965569 RepID=UPI000B3A7BF9|nr:Lrp/AsnC family transcriptional regulator [Lachnoclostridium sp. An169]OUP85077.1 AsnC family transcriptional regulator [Lachnoclostridium sp. An169]HJA64901.1 Lrp/AsnC family transcriptional regulator [Candidatus Mediterraneibacter cottocaccae]
MNEKKEALRIEILKYIEKHSRVALDELAVLLGVEETDVANEMAEMEKEKIICGYHTLIDWDRAGVEMVTALIEVRVTPQRDQGFDRIAERIYNYPEVYSVYLISGSYDLLVTIEGKTLKEVSRFVSEKLSPIDEVLSTATHFILKKYKDHGTIMVPKKGLERMLVTP